MRGNCPWAGRHPLGDTAKEETESLAICTQTDTGDICNTARGSLVPWPLGQIPLPRAETEGPLKPSTRRQEGSGALPSVHVTAGAGLGHQGSEKQGHTPSLTEI